MLADAPAVVREWHASALRGKGGRVSIQQAYRLLRAVMNTAVRDGAIVKNPCQIVGAGIDRAKERPVASPAQVVALVEAITPRYRAAVLLAAWCGLRRGEVLGLRRADVDLTTAVVTVRRNRVELLATGAAFDADPKTDAGKRTVTIPPHVLPVLAEHMTSWAGLDRVFVGRDGRPMRGDAVRQAFGRARPSWDARLPVPRSASHRPDHGRGDWCDHQGSDAPPWSRFPGRVVPVPACGRWPRRRDSFGAVRTGCAW